MEGVTSSPHCLLCPENFINAQQFLLSEYLTAIKGSILSFHMAGSRSKRADTWAASIAPVSPEQILRDSRGPHDENSDNRQMEELAQRSRAYTEGEGNPRVKNTATDSEYLYQGDVFLKASWQAMAGTFSQTQAENLALYCKAMHDDSEDSPESSESTFDILREADLTKVPEETSATGNYRKAAVKSLEKQPLELQDREFGVRERRTRTESEDTLVSLNDPDLYTSRLLFEQQEAAALDALAEVLGRGTEEEDASWLNQYDGATAMELADYTDDDSAALLEHSFQENKGIDYEEFISQSRELIENPTDYDVANLSPCQYNDYPVSNESVRSSSMDSNNACVITEREVDHSDSDSSYQTQEQDGLISAIPKDETVTVTHVEDAKGFDDNYRVEDATDPETGCTGTVENIDEATWLRRPSPNIPRGSKQYHDSGSLFYNDDKCWPPLPKFVPPLDQSGKSKLESPKPLGKSKIRFKVPIDDREKNDDLAKNNDHSNIDDKNTMMQKVLDLERRLNFLTAAQRSRDEEDFENSQINHRADSANTESMKRLERKVDTLLEKVAILYDLIPEIRNDILNYHVAAYDMRKEATAQQKKLITALILQAQESEFERDMDNHDWFEQVLWPQGDPEFEPKEHGNPSYSCTVM